MARLKNILSLDSLLCTKSISIVMLVVWSIKSEARKGKKDEICA